MTKDEKHFACILLGGVQLVDEIECLEVLDDGHGRLLVSHEPLFQTLLVVISPEAERVKVTNSVIVKTSPINRLQL